MAQDLTFENAPGIRVAIDAIDEKKSDPANNTSHVIRNAVLLGSTFNRDDIFNLIASRVFGAGMETYEDVDADGFTSKHIAEAALLLYRKLSSHWGPEGASFIISRLPVRFYMNGIHSASNKDTKLCDYSADVFGTQDQMNTRLAANGYTAEKAREMSLRMITGVPYEAVTVAINMLNGRVSKRMLLRIMVTKMKTIHNANLDGGIKNIFTTSLEKYSLEVAEESVATEWRFFGAPFHPAFPNGSRAKFSEIQKEIFASATANVSAAAPFKPL